MKKHVLIAAGGTGGHVYPGVTVARELQRLGQRVSWLGTANGLEATVVVRHKIQIYFLPISGLRGKGLKKWLLAPFQIIASVVKAVSLMRKIKPDVVLGMGGYVAGPAGIAARLLRIPLVIHEQNIIPGLTNKVLSRLSTKACVAFPDSQIFGGNQLYTGNPVREDLVNLPIPAVRFINHSRSKRILVLGGSLGALTLNTLLPKVFFDLSGLDLEVWHQTGKQHFAAAQKIYTELEDLAPEPSTLKLKLVPFIDDMASALVWADLVICRAGAMTLAELAMVGVPSLLIPYPYAVDDHQYLNACYYAKQGAALVYKESEVTLEILKSQIESLFSSPEELRNMANKAYALRCPNACQEIVSICLKSV